MKIGVLSLTCFGLCLILIQCAAYQVSFDKDISVDFSQYKTFAWYAKEPRVFKNEKYDNQIIESNIKNYVSAELKRKGLSVDVDNPDLLFDYNLMIETKMSQVEQPVYSHPYNYGYYNPYRPNANPYTYPQTIVDYKIQNIPYQDGTLTITCVDKKTNRLIWRGWSEGTLINSQIYESELPKDIHDIMKQFPIKLLQQK